MSEPAGEPPSGFVPPPLAVALFCVAPLASRCAAGAPPPPAPPLHQLLGSLPAASYGGAPCVACSPWKTPQFASVLVETSRKGLLTLPGFLAMWAYTAAEDPRAALAGALYLGYPDDAPADRLFQVSRPRRAERTSKGSIGV